MNKNKSLIDTVIEAYSKLPPNPFINSRAGHDFINMHIVQKTDYVPGHPEMNDVLTANHINTYVRSNPHRNHPVKGEGFNKAGQTTNPSYNQDHGYMPGEDALVAFPRPKNYVYEGDINEFALDDKVRRGSHKGANGKVKFLRWGKGLHSLSRHGYEYTRLGSGKSSTRDELRKRFGHNDPQPQTNIREGDIKPGQRTQLSDLSQKDHQSAIERLRKRLASISPFQKTISSKGIQQSIDTHQAHLKEINSSYVPKGKDSQDTWRFIGSLKSVSRGSGLIKAGKVGPNLRTPEYSHNPTINSKTPKSVGIVREVREVRKVSGLGTDASDKRDTGGKPPNTSGYNPKDKDKNDLKTFDNKIKAAQRKFQAVDESYVVVYKAKRGTEEKTSKPWSTLEEANAHAFEMIESDLYESVEVRNNG